MSGVGRILAPQAGPQLSLGDLAPVTDNMLVTQARSAVRAPVLLPEHQHFINTLDSFGQALDQYSSALDQGINKLREERLNPQSLAPEEPMTIVQNRTPQLESHQSRAKAILPKKAIPPKEVVQAGYKKNPGQLLGQLLAVLPSEPNQKAVAKPQEEMAAQILASLVPQDQPRQPARPLPAAPSPVPIQQTQGVKPSAISSTPIPGAAPQSPFVFRRPNA